MESLPTSDREAITHIWSLFSAAPADQRTLILKGLLSACCMPQLSFLYDEIKPLLRIDFSSILPREISLRIFSFLDAKSLCHAAQVSQAWRSLADDDALWHRMCEQHIDKKCTKCGWGLPLLDKRPKRRSANTKLTTVTDGMPLRTACGPATRRPWKEVYSERLVVERNWRRNNYNVRILQGHTDGVMCVQFCDTNNVVMTGSYDKTIRVWSLETGEELRRMEGHRQCVRALQFDNCKLVTGAMDNTLKIWDWHSGRCIRTLEGHTGGVLSLHFDSRLLASGSTDHTIRVWDFRAGACCTLTGHNEWVNCVRICSHDNNLLVSASDDSTIKVWDLQSKACIQTLQGHVGQVQVALPSPKGFNHRLTSSSRLPGNVHPHDPKVHSLSDAPIIVSAALDNTIKFWNFSGSCLRTLFGHVEGVWALAFDSLRVVSGSHDRTVRIWDMESGKCMHALEGHSGPVTTVALSDTKLISASDDGEVRIWDFGPNH
ncbi:quinon protein alcohol dehydrogenase-like superfamily [Dichotomocladium elegans]|nr:quinon protein alcohol dehydrogenase-like superfamily [Dichotomocladium elegans]